MGCVSVTLTLDPLTGVNRSDRTSTSSYSTGTFHTQAEANIGVNSDADSTLRAAMSIAGELLPAEVELLELLLLWNFLMLTKLLLALRPTLVGLHPTEEDKCMTDEWTATD